MWSLTVLLTIFSIYTFGVADAQVLEACRTDAYPPANSALETHIVNLDLPPAERWTKIVESNKVELHKLLETFQTIIGGKLMKYLNFIFGLMLSWLPQPYAEEINGIANAAGLNIGEAVLYNVFYEIFSACTSILGQDENGKIYHARNMDFGLFLGWDTKNNTWLVSEILRKLVIQVDFQRNGKTLYKTITFVGYVGVMTAVKPNAFTFTLNERYALDGGYVGLIKWALKMGKSKAKFVGFFTRDVMENATSYAEAQQMFKTEEVLAPAYFILGGTKPGEASIITRGRTKTIDTWELSKSNNWFILETNYDHWKKPLFLDDRRTPATKCMNEMTQKSLGFKGLFNVLTTKPVLNKLTTYTALMQVNDGTLDGYIQFCKDPCYPF